jgi:carbon-monoxide dehydrogenase medium subunit
VAYGAQVVATGTKGERVIPIDEFFVSIFTTALQPDEILTEIRIPMPAAKSGGAYVKLERKVGDFATAAAAVQLTLDGAGAVQKVGIALTNVGATPIKGRIAEEFLRGKKPDAANLAKAAELASQEAQPSADLRGPVEFKVGLAKELTKRALALAVERAGK